jgi:hypothetical protein
MPEAALVPVVVVVDVAPTARLLPKAGLARTVLEVDPADGLEGALGRGRGAGFADEREDDVAPAVGRAAAVVVCLGGGGGGARRCLGNVAEPGRAGGPLLNSLLKKSSGL